MTTKIHGAVDGLGNPVCLFLSAGNESDIKNAPQLLCTLSLDGTIVNADRGYDSQPFADWLISIGAIPNIPSRERNKVQRVCDWWEYKERHLIECFWQKIKQFRRVATRYDKLAKSFLGFVYLAAVMVLLK
ncbi:DDE transposase [Clostridia bacterium]|nr:DDE transposase [Clostridia bacterium]